MNAVERGYKLVFCPVVDHQIVFRPQVVEQDRVLHKVVFKLLIKLVLPVRGRVLVVVVQLRPVRVDRHDGVVLPVHCDGLGDKPGRLHHSPLHPVHCDGDVLHCAVVGSVGEGLIDHRVRHHLRDVVPGGQVCAGGVVGVGGRDPGVQDRQLRRVQIVVVRTVSGLQVGLPAVIAQRIPADKVIHPEQATVGRVVSELPGLRQREKFVSVVVCHAEAEAVVASLVQVHVVLADERGLAVVVVGACRIVTDKEDHARLPVDALANIFVDHLRRVLIRAHVVVPARHDRIICLL